MDEKWQVCRKVMWYRGSETIEAKLLSSDKVEVRLEQILLGEGWKKGSFGTGPLHRLPSGTVAAEELDDRTAELVARLDRLGVKGSRHLLYKPIGWFRVLEAMVERMEEIASTVGEIRILDMKEKYGALRTSLSCTSEDHGDLIADLEAWVEGQGEDRCMLTGNPGKLRATGWMITLDDASFALWQESPDLVDEMIYPTSSKPQAF